LLHSDRLRSPLRFVFLGEADAHSLCGASAEPAHPPIRRTPTVKPCGKHSPAVSKKMLSVVLVAWPTVRGYRPKVFRHYQIAILTL